MNQVQTTPYKVGFKNYLKSVLLERCRKNPNYSLRAFAKSIEVNHAHLSLILRGHRPLTAKFIKKVGSALGVTPQELSHYLKDPKSHLSKNKITSLEETALQNLEMDQFNSISDWWHDAILELVRVRAFKNDPKWIAQKLSISIAQVNDAVERLQRLGLIVRDKEGEITQDFVDTTSNISNSVTSSALRSYQKTVTEMSLKSLENQPRTIRDHTSMTLAVSGRDIEKAKALIAEFRVRFMEIMQAQPSQLDEVYQLGVSFFPLTKVEVIQKEQKPKEKDL